MFVNVKKDERLKEKYTDVAMIIGFSKGRF